MIEILIGALVAVGVGRYIVKGYSPTGVLMTGGLLLLIISVIMAEQYYHQVQQQQVMV